MYMKFKAWSVEKGISYTNELLRYKIRLWFLEPKLPYYSLYHSTHSLTHSIFSKLTPDLLIKTNWP